MSGAAGETQFARLQRYWYVYGGSGNVSSALRRFHLRNAYSGECSMAVAITLDELSEELRRRRTDEGLSLRDVEDATGISAATLSRIERGSTPDFDIVKKLAKWLDVVVGTDEASTGAPK